MDNKISPFGWLMVACGFLVLLVTNGMTLTGVTVFDNALLGEFGWQRGALKLRDLITFAGAGLIAPFFGALADRGYIKNCLILGCAFLAAGFITYSNVQSLGDVYLAHAFFGLSLASAGIVSVVFLVSTHVPATRRGLALGLALVGSSLGNSVFPQLNLGLLKASNWRDAMLVLAFIPAVLAIVVTLVVRRRTRTLPQATEARQRVPLAQVFKNPTFWKIGTIAMLTFFAILGVSSHAFLRLTGVGMDSQAAGSAIALLFMMGLVGKLFAGICADKLSVRTLMAASLLLMIVGSLGLGQFANQNIFLWVVCFGLGWGALYTLIQVSTVSSFGSAGAGRILGGIAVLEALGGGLGPWVVGLTFDATGSYSAGFALVTSGLVLALVLSFFLEAQPVGSTDAVAQGESQFIPY